MTEVPSPAVLLPSDGPLADQHDLVIFDLDGVVYLGPEAVPGAPEVIEALHAGRGVRRPVPCCYLTNNASRTPQDVAVQLRDLGVPADADEVVNSAQVAAALLAERLGAGDKVLVVGGDGLRAALRGEGLQPVDSMDDDPRAVVQGFSPDLDWRLLAEGTRAVRAGLLWVASNLDQTFPTAHGPAPGNGTFVHAVAVASGRQPDLVAGKPRPEPFLDAARRADSRAPIVVGDRLDTDLEGARAAGMPALAVLSGIVGASELMTAEPEERPTQVDTDLSGLLRAHPEVAVDGATARCRAAQVEFSGKALRVVAAGEDPVDLLRAGCAAAWSLSPAGGDPVLDRDGVEGVVHALAAFDSARSWAR